MKKDKVFKDISKDFSVESMEMILAAVELAYEKGLSVCHCAHLAYVLLLHERIQRISKELTIDIEAFRNALLEHVKQAQPKYPVSSGKVVFDPTLRKTIINAYLFAKDINVNC